MKKLREIIFLFFLITINIISLQVYNVVKTHNSLYSDKVEIDIKNYKEDIDFDKIFRDISDISKKYNINISQYINNSDRSIYIFSTNPKNDKEFKLEKGEFPKNNSSQYVSNKFEKDNIGVLKIPSNIIYIRIYSFDQIKNWGLDQKFIISNLQKEDYNDVINTFNGFGDIEINYGENNIFWGYLLNNNPELIVCFIISFLVLLLMITYYLISSKKLIAIKDIFGHSKISVIKRLIYPLILEFVICDVISVSIICLYNYISNRKSINIEFILMTIVLLLVLLLGIVLYSILLFNLIYETIKLKDILRGKGDKINLNRLINLNKLILFTIIIFIGVLINYNYYLLKNRLNTLDYWNKTQNIYKIFMSHVPDMDNLSEGRSQNESLKNLYKKLEKNKQAFIIDSENYGVINGSYIYEKAIESGRFEYGADGKCITIDINYLKQNPIKPYNTNKSIKYLVDNNKNTLNLLVPYKYKSLEKQIYDSYLDTFYLQKVRVDNLYREYMNLPKNKISKDDLKINIIYVNNNQEYFTFSSDLGDTQNKNCIIDPITIIYTDNVDSSYIAKWMSNDMYFVDKSEGNAYLDIAKYFKETNTENMMQKFVKSIYLEANEEIITLQSRINNLVFILIILLVVTMFFSLTCISLFYKNNSYKIYLKTLLGYSMINNNLKIIYTITIINSIAILLNLLLNFTYLKLILFIGVGVTIFEILLISIFSIYLSKQNINKIIKGEK